jgi:hypothetical protein
MQGEHDRFIERTKGNRSMVAIHRNMRTVAEGDVNPL